MSFASATVKGVADDGVIFDFARVSQLAEEESELYVLLKRCGRLQTGPLNKADMSASSHCNLMGIIMYPYSL